MLPAAQARLLLVINHVVSREAAAMAKLQAHAGRRLRVELTGQPSWWPALPPLRTQISRAGLFEPEGDAFEGEPDLTLSVAMPNPQQLLAALAGNATPDVRIDGDAAVAADMHWLVDNLRWDIEADLARALGPTPARVVMSVGRTAARSLRRSFAPAGPAR